VSTGRKPSLFRASNIQTHGVNKPPTTSERRLTDLIVRLSYFEPVIVFCFVGLQSNRQTD
jgi:hypothetical protein